MTPSFDTRESVTAWLKSMERRRRVALFVDRSALTASAVLVAVALLVLADRWLALPTSVRGGAAVLVGLAAAVSLLLALRIVLRPLSSLTAAHAIERHRPELDERLLTLANHSTNIAPKIELQLRTQIAQQLRDRPLRVAWPARRMLIFVTTALVLFSTLVFTARQKLFTRELHRVLRPWAPLPATLAPLIRIGTSASAVRPGDQPVTVEVSVARAGDIDTVLLHVSDAAGETTIAMTPLGQNRFTRTLSNLLQSADLYATAGDIRSRTVRVHVVATPPVRPKPPTTKAAR